MEQGSRTPSFLETEHRAVEADIRAAFRHVSRAGGVSWSESEVIDGYGEAAERAEARKRDIDTAWEDLIDDRRWDPGAGTGGFCFLDPIGFRYYLAPALIRCLQNPSSDHIRFHLMAGGSCRSLNQPQQRAIARFVKFMIAWNQRQKFQLGVEWWTETYDSYWKSIAADAEQRAT